MICQRLYCSIPSKYFVEFPVMVDLADQFCIILGTIPYLPYIHTYIQLVSVLQRSIRSLSLLLCVARALLSRLIHFNSSFLSFSFYHTRLEREEKNPIPLLSLLLFILLLFFPFIFLISLLSSSSPPLPANSLSERSETGLQAIRRFWSIGYNRPLLLPAAPVLLSNRVQLEPALTSLLFIRRLLAQTANSFSPEILPPVSRPPIRDPRRLRFP